VNHRGESRTVRFEKLNPERGGAYLNSYHVLRQIRGVTTTVEKKNRRERRRGQIRKGEEGRPLIRQKKKSILLRRQSTLRSDLLS